MILDDVDPETRRVLERFEFDAETFEALRARVSAGELLRQGHSFTHVRGNGFHY